MRPLGIWKYLHNYSTSQSEERKWLMHCRIGIHIKFETSYQKKEKKEKNETN